MKKKIDLCKTYLPEILLILLTTMLIGVFIICWQRFSGFVMDLCAAMIIFLEMCIAFGLSHLPIKSLKAFKITLYLCFVLWAMVLIIGIILSTQDNKEILGLGAFSSVAFCALFSDLAIATHLSCATTKRNPVLTKDSCDDD